MKRCLFGGSFDPVHLGHLAIARRAVAGCGLDEMVFLPAARSPLKEANPAASDGQRLNMLELALHDVPWAVIDRTDLELPPPSWSWRVAEHFHSLYPGDGLFWLMGADQWNDLERWGRWGYLSELVTFIVHYRSEALAERKGVSAVFIEGEHPASSSEIRRRLATGQSVPAGWLDEKVLHYIEQERLYH